MQSSSCSRSGLALFFLYIGAILALSSLARATGDYDENLSLRPLPGNSLFASFRFRTSGSIHGNHMELFPRSLNQVLQASGTKELHLRFTLGRWNAEEYGAQPGHGQTAGGTGVELWAWVEAKNDDEAFARWTSLTNALSGLFCASLNFIDGTRTIRPLVTFQPSGDFPGTDMSRMHLLHGSLPREPVCTENLTPFLKLLPCKGKLGISSLLDGHRLFDANWQSMSIDVRPVCDEHGSCKLELEQVVEMVIDTDRSLRRKDSPVPRPRPFDQLECDQTKPYTFDGTACFPIDNGFDIAWTLSDIFGKRINGQCPLGIKDDTTLLRVCIEMPEPKSTLLGPGIKEKRFFNGTRCFFSEGTENMDIMVPQQAPAILSPHEEPPLYVERSFTGYGQERGGVQIILSNPSLDHGVDLVYLESLPWFMKPFLHTLSATVQNSTIDLKERLIDDLYYQPAVDRKRGSHLEIRMHVPPQETVVVTYDFEKAILRYTEYPPDANRGFDIAPAILSIFPRTTNGERTYLRTTSLLLNLPTPDFSMPYNVIILSSTVMALAFGSMFNLLVRMFVPAEGVPGLGKRLASKLQAIQRRWK